MAISFCNPVNEKKPVLVLLWYCFGIALVPVLVSLWLSLWYQFEEFTVSIWYLFGIALVSLFCCFYPNLFFLICLKIEERLFLVFFGY